MDLSKKQLDEIAGIVKKYLPEHRVFIFGSRAQNKHFPSSDLDVGVMGKQVVLGNIKVRIEEELENSDLPFKIDLVDFKTVSPEFCQLALQKTINI
ncbi:MAG: nucleotidyltransferase domain-containing protein [Patescibacteria group bacterium]